jgi:hypothetical protein
MSHYVAICRTALRKIVEAVLRRSVLCCSEPALWQHSTVTRCAALHYVAT